MDEDILIESDADEAYIDTVDDGISMDPDESNYSYWEIIKFSVLSYLSNPWALLILAFLLYKIYGKLRDRFLEPFFYRYEEWKEKQKQQSEAAEMKKNPDQYRAKMEAMELARNRMQEQYKRSADEWKERLAAREEQKRQQDIEDWENHKQGKGYKSRSNAGEDKEREALEQQARIKGKKGFRPDYNPLMGMGGGSGYRPSRRVVGGGG